METNIIDKQYNINPMHKFHQIMVQRFNSTHICDNYREQSRTTTIIPTLIQRIYEHTFTSRVGIRGIYCFILKCLS